MSVERKPCDFKLHYYTNATAYSPLHPMYEVVYENSAII